MRCSSSNTSTIRCASCSKLKARRTRPSAQIQPAHFFVALDPESNSVAVIMKHVAGNMRSRWTDFLTTDGEKPDRDRDTEFDWRGRHA